MSISLKKMYDIKVFDVDFELFSVSDPKKPSFKITPKLDIPDSKYYKSSYKAFTVSTNIVTHRESLERELHKQIKLFQLDINFISLISFEELESDFLFTINYCTIFKPPKDPNFDLFNEVVF